MKEDGGPAFPPNAGWRDDDAAARGMSMRDYFAAKAMQGFLANGSQRLIAHEIENSHEGQQVADIEAMRAIVNAQLALGSYRIADAMLAERDK